MEEQTFSHQESIELITKMINRAKNYYYESGLGALLWGFTNVICFVLAYLASKGYSIFTDDICVMQHKKAAGSIYCTASFPMIKLWETTINDLDSARFTKDFRLRPQLPKFGQFFYEEFSAATIELGKIVILTAIPAATREVVTRLTGVKAFKHLKAHAYRPHLMLDKGVQDLHFAMLTEIANNIPVYELQRPVVGTKVEHAFEAIKSIIDEI